VKENKKGVTDTFACRRILYQ